ncbi:MAG: hypothetical protein RBU21_14420 [FCB group bacterium]|jgi:hypothetical protein|nr:hypothetical protein [FCB group bacterium]
MEAIPEYKLKRCETLYLEIPSIRARLLSPSEMEQLKAALRQRSKEAGFLSPEHEAPSDLFDGILENAALTVGANMPARVCEAARKGFLLSEVLAKNGLETDSEEVFVDWGGYSVSEEHRYIAIALQDLCAYWKGLWQEGCDDTLIIEANLRWVLLCGHHGAMAYAKFDP